MLPSKKRKELEALLTRIGKRPAAVLRLILEKGSVSTYELGQLGYDQPPRAAQDLKEHGVRLRTSFGRHPKSGARMAIYQLDEESIVGVGFVGRRTFTSQFRKELFEKYENRCNVCNIEFSPITLQIDHRIPYIVGGDSNTHSIDHFQPLCAPDQRKKSWACEHCPNRIVKNPETCRTCFWAFPDTNYVHVATLEIRKLEIAFSEGEEIKLFDAFSAIAKSQNSNPSDVVKQMIYSFVEAKRK